MESLAGHKYISLVTFRKNGAGVSTPVWFAAEGGRLYVYTVADSGKVKRLKRDRHVQVAPCTANGKVVGPYFEADCRFLTGPGAEAANALLDRKYGITKRLMNFFSRFRPTKRAFLEISAR